MISAKLEKAFNQQIVNELYASNSYLAIAAFMDTVHLKVFAAHFFKQSEEEREHALKLVRYLLDVGGTVKIGSVPAADTKHKTVEGAIKFSLDQEIMVSDQINKLMAAADEEHDYAARSFLKWFVDEQVEEVASMSELLGLVQRAGEHQLLLVEDRLSRGTPLAGGFGGGKAE